jgi:2-keto-3-deoxy-6-phosphogluconate aldolase
MSSSGWGKITSSFEPAQSPNQDHYGINLLKFFPSENMGGLKIAKAILDSFPQVRFISTGGIRLDNIAEYLQNPRGGLAMIAEGNFSEVQ